MSGGGCRAAEVSLWAWSYDSRICGLRRFQLFVLTQAGFWGRMTLRTSWIHTLPLSSQVSQNQTEHLSVVLVVMIFHVSLVPPPRGIRRLLICVWGVLYLYYENMRNRQLSNERSAQIRRTNAHKPSEGHQEHNYSRYMPDNNRNTRVDTSCVSEGELRRYYRRCYISK